MLDDLILLRLLAVADPARGEIRSRVAADLRPFAGEATRSAGREAFAAALARLVQAGDVLAGGRRATRLQLTDAGRDRVHAAFHLPGGAPPARVRGWAWWRDRYAVPRALGVRRTDTAETLRAALLRRFYLPELSSNPSVGSLLATVDLLIARQLRTPQATLGAFRTAALRAWVNDGSTASAPTVSRLPDDENDFAAAVLAAARGSTTGRFGDNKVFISHAWNALVTAGRAAPDEERSFKERLVRANTAGRLRLGRADLAGAHDARDVRASETPYLGEVFHFVRLD